jgi:predicted 2-oxoglutarate/Fe(II)-dependent dioxygenase YbiX
MPDMLAFSTEILLAAGSVLCFTVAAVGFVLALCRAAAVADFRWEQAVEDRRRTREDQQVARLEEIPVPGRWQTTFPDAGDMGRTDGLGG